MPAPRINAGNAILPFGLFLTCREKKNQRSGMCTICTCLYKEIWISNDHNNLFGQHECECADMNIRLARFDASNLLKLLARFSPMCCEFPHGIPFAGSQFSTVHTQF